MLKLFSLPTLIVFDFHIHDLYKLTSSDRISSKDTAFVYRQIFKRIYQNEKVTNGLVILNNLIAMLLEKGYNFWKLEDVYRAVSE